MRGLVRPRRHEASGQRERRRGPRSEVASDYVASANVKPWPLEGLGAAHGYALCEEGSCEAAEQCTASDTSGSWKCNTSVHFQHSPFQEGCSLFVAT
eukprot:3840553-Prymnesium_polylepis.1